MSYDPLKFIVKFRVPFATHPTARWVTLAKFLNEGEAVEWMRARLEEETGLVREARIPAADAYYWGRVTRGGRTELEVRRRILDSEDRLSVGKDAAHE